jgi:hypothetical protein
MKPSTKMGRGSREWLGPAVHQGLSAGIRVNAGPSREDFAIVHWRRRVVPLRTVNDRLTSIATTSGTCIG